MRKLTGSFVRFSPSVSSASSPWPKKPASDRDALVGTWKITVDPDDGSGRLGIGPAPKKVPGRPFKGDIIKGNRSNQPNHVPGRDSVRTEGKYTYPPVKKE